jgi:hypothetical protein
LLLSPAVARGDDTALLERFRPVCVHDAQERDRTFPDPNDEAGGNWSVIRRGWS